MLVGLLLVSPLVWFIRGGLGEVFEEGLGLGNVGTCANL